MNITRLTPEDYTVSRWAGGTTTELAIAPAGAVYGDRDFLWRISSAEVELDSSDFTPLPGYHRLICVLRGEMRLRHDGGAVIALAPYEVHGFDGAASTHSEGRCTDFNLMLRKGRCRGSLEAIRLAGEDVAPLPALAKGTTALLYCAEGAVTLRAGGQAMDLSPGQALLLADAGEVCALVESWRDSVLLFAQMKG